MGDTIEEMDKENEFEDKKGYFSAKRIGKSGEENLQELEEVNLIERLDKTDRLERRLDKTLNKNQTN